MSTTRRDFLTATGLAGAGLAMNLNHAKAAVVGRRPDAGTSEASGAQEAKRLLILGGTGFIGPHMVRYAVERGHHVSIFTRGRSQPDLPDSVEKLVGDRSADMSALEGRSWDVIVDNNANDYRWVQRSTELLKDSTQHYVYVSSISAYAGDGGPWDFADRVLWEPELHEDSERFSPPADWSDGDDAHFGLTKAIAENTAMAAFPGHSTVVRPGLIVGPGDRTDRFTYWPIRINEGGEVLAPGNPRHANQIIDQRDLTEFIVRLAESETAGVFNATGPTTRMSMAEMLYGIRAATSAPVKFTWVSEGFLEEREVRPWGDLPSWMPGAALMFVSIERALAAGLTFRPLAVTTRDTIDWYKTRPPEQRENPRAGMSRERERELLAAWHKQRSDG